jgi:hypothetical protein
MPGAPERGDVVIRSTHRTESVFAVTVWGTATHATTCATYDDALRLANRTAVATRTDVWYSDDGVSFHLVVTYRHPL